MSVEYYVKVGNTINLTKDKPHDGFAHRVIAKKITEVENPRFYVALASSFILNPRDLSDREMKSHHNGFMQVSPEIFEKYVNFAMGTSNISFKVIERLCQ